MKPYVSVFFILIALLLAACGAVTGQQSVVMTTIPVEEAELGVAAADEAIAAVEWDGQVMQVDEQGVVTVSVTPLNLDNPGETIDFQVSMDTHSVDLSMDLAANSVISTEYHIGLIGVSWDGAAGGHHVSGILKFPAEMDGQPLLEGASRITLTIGGVDDVERKFSWSR